MGSKGKLPKFLIGFFVAGLIILIVKGYFVQRNIGENGVVSIGKYTSHSKNGKHQNNVFTYFVNGLQHTADGGPVSDGFEKNTGKFYQIKYASDNEYMIIADYEKEVTDSAAIAKAGFKIPTR